MPTFDLNCCNAGKGSIGYSALKYVATDYIHTAPGNPNKRGDSSSSSCSYSRSTWYLPGPDAHDLEAGLQSGHTILCLLQLEAVVPGWGQI